MVAYVNGKLAIMRISEMNAQAMSDHRHKIRKPKLVFFRPKYGPTIPAFLRIHRDEHMRCLSQFFNVTAIEDDWNFQQVCDLHEPDACLMEIGLQLLDIRRPRISGLQSRSPVPLLALMNADAWGKTRTRIVAEAEALDFAAIFAICTTAGEHFPQLKQRLFYWPNFIDQDTFKLRQQHKTDLVSLVGHTGAEYPWRKRVRNALLQRVPCRESPHAGYVSSAAHSMPSGVAYANMIGAAWFAPTCGTMANDLVRKHLEIPAVGTALISERTAILELAGFTDMRNVIFADEHDVVDKVTHLMRDIETLRRIIKSGHDLVHDRHTMQVRSQICDWLALRSQQSPDAHIVQPDPFGKLVLQHGGSQEQQSRHIAGHGRHLRLLDEAVGHINLDRFELALAAIEEFKLAAPNMLDADFLASYCCLHAGNPTQALKKLVRLNRVVLDSSETIPPDPVEWAYLIVALLAIGRMRAAVRRAREFSELSHLQLDRARVAAFFLARRLPPVIQQRNVASVHRIDDRSLSQWFGSLVAILEKCGRLRYAEQLRSVPWESLQTANQVFSVESDVRNAWQQSLPATSHRLRRWDNPFVISAIRQRIRSLLS